MEIYKLSPLGQTLSHTNRYPDTPEWRVIHYLAKMHSATKEKILAEVPGSSTSTLMKLRIPRHGRQPILITE